MRWFLAAALGLLSGCDRSDLKVLHLLGDLRVLALVADTPEVAPGAVVNVTPLVSDLRGGGRALTYSAEGCIDPGLEVGAELTCAGRPDRVVLATDVALPLPGPNYLGDAPAVAVTIPANILDGRTPVQQANGYAYLFFYTVKAPNGVDTKAFKRIFASLRPTKNSNPVVGSVMADNAALAALPSVDTNLKLTVDPASKEDYTTLDSKGDPIAKKEEPLISWYVSDGALSLDRTIDAEDTRFTPPRTVPVGRNVTVTAVVRDRRGGETTFTYAFP